MQCLQLFLLLVVASLAVPAQSQPTPGPYCTPMPTRSPGATDPPLPQLPESFQTRVEVNINLKRTTIDAEELYDVPNKRSVLRMTREGFQTTSYINYQTNEVYIVIAGKCKVQQLNTSDVSVLFGRVNIDGKNFIYSVGSAFKFGRQFGEKYMGVDVVRGIQVDRWQSCMRWKYPSANFTVDYYFAWVNWTTTFSYPQVPIRAVVEGVSNDQGFHAFKHVYDFVNFRPFADQDPKTYQIPEGVYCPGRKKVQPIPYLPSAYSYLQEIYVPTSGILINSQVYYNQNYKLVRYDTRTENPVIEIHDFNTGVKYTKDVTNGGCTMDSINNSSFDVKMKNYTEALKDPQYVLRMKSPQELFFIDNSYIYVGRTTKRGIPCDRYTSRRTDFKLAGSPPFNATFEYCVLIPDILELGNRGIDPVTNVPVYLDIISDIYISTYSFYDFDTQNTDLSVFDVTDCYPEGLKQDFQVRMPGPYYGGVSENLKLFSLSAVLNVANVTGVSPLRIQNPKIDWDDQNVYLTSTLLDKVPYYAIFTPIDGGLVTRDITVDGPVELEQCASYCQSNRDDQFNPIQCNAFAQCKGGQCILSTNHISPAVPKVPGTECVYYSRNVDTYTKAEVELSDAIMKLKNAVYRGSFNIDIKLDDLSGTIQRYTADSVKTDISRGGQRDGSGPYMRNFKRLSDSILADDNLIILDQVLSVDECAKACVSRTEISCQSLNYCYGIGVCFLSTINADDEPELIIPVSYCDLYARNYIDKFEKMPGKSVITKEATSVPDTDSPEQCANACVNSMEIDCKSFDFCATTKTCLLGEKHVLEVPLADQKEDPSCDHYSRKYIDDFIATQSKVIKVKDSSVVSGISVEQCSKVCIDQLGNQCKGFDYCGNTTDCIITSEYIRNQSIGSITNRGEEYCTHYSRYYYPDGTPFVPHIDNIIKTVVGHSDGAMAGIAIGMLLVGVILALVVLVIVYRAKGGKLDDMKVAFYNREET